MRITINSIALAALATSTSAFSVGPLNTVKVRDTRLNAGYLNNLSPPTSVPEKQAPEIITALEANVGNDYLSQLGGAAPAPAPVAPAVPAPAPVAPAPASSTDYLSSMIQDRHCTY